MDNNFLYPQFSQSLKISKQLSSIIEIIKESNLNSLTQHQRIIKEILPTYSTLQYSQLNNLSHSIKQMYNFESMSEILKLQSDIGKKLTLSSKIYFEHLQKIPKIQINIPKTTIHNFSDYYKSNFRIPLMLEDIINKSLQNPDKVNNLLLKNIDKTLYNNDTNFSNSSKKSRTKKTYYTQNINNYYIDTVNITYQLPATEESNDRFNKTPNDDGTKEGTTEKSVYTILHFLDIVFKLITFISILPDTVKGSTMIYNVLKNILDYLI